MIDLTKAIKFAGYSIGPAEHGIDDETEFRFTVEIHPKEQEAYRRLFEAAPKMLARLAKYAQRYGDKETVDLVEEITGKPIEFEDAEIEGGAR